MKLTNGGRRQNSTLLIPVEGMNWKGRGDLAGVLGGPRVSRGCGGQEPVHSVNADGATHLRGGYINSIEC